ncbi:MAG: ribosome silencing factor [Oscillospiraceae bacterium]|nr:ribosome silencing factor [Oscillospiraceae bacterium]
MEPFEAAKLAVQALADKQASDIRLLKTTELTVLADYFLICTANSTPHVRTLYDEVDKRLSEAGLPTVRREGYRNSNWLLLDFGCLIVHIFQKETREFYNLERLWSDAQEIDIAEIEA